MRWRRKIIGLTVVFCLFLGGVVSAHEIIQGDLCIIEADQTLTGNVFVLCQELIVEGRVDGNLIGAAVTATLNGEITGSTYLLAWEFEAAGTLGDDLHFLGGLAHLDKTLNLEHGDVMAVNLSTIIPPEVTIPGSVIQVGYQLVLDGTVEKDVSFWGSALEIGGEAAGNVNATVGDSASEPGWLLKTITSLGEVDLTDSGLTVSRTGKIGGSLRYAGPTEGIIQGKIKQGVEYTSTNTAIPINLAEPEKGINLYLAQVIHEFISLSLIGILALLVLPRWLQAPIDNLRRHPFTNLGWGLPALFLPLVILFIIIVLTIPGMVLLSALQLMDLALVGGFITLILSIGGVSLFYFVAIFIARIIVCLAVGKMLLRVFAHDDGRPMFLFGSLLIGTLLLAIIGSLPEIGLVINAVVLALGLGAILTLVQAQIRLIRETPGIYTYIKQQATRKALPSGEFIPYLPPPASSDLPPEPGMNNLPPGFTWWEDEE